MTMRIGDNTAWIAAACAAALLLVVVAVWAFRPARSVRVEYHDREYRGVPDDKTEAVKRMFDGQIGIDTLKHAEKVEAFRISMPTPAMSADNRVENYPVLAGPVGVPTDLATTVTTALLSPDSYGWEWVKACEPEYGVCLSFSRQSERIDVFLCFHCSQLMIVHNGVVCGGEDFDYMHATLVRAAKAIFPSDSVIQAVSEKSCATP